jgi:hypothetical protein
MIIQLFICKEKEDTIAFMNSITTARHLKFNKRKRKRTARIRGRKLRRKMKIRIALI